MAVINPIFPGFAWSQAFDLPTGFVQIGDAYRAEFRSAMDFDGPAASVSIGSGIVVQADRLFVRLTKLQTSAMHAPGMVVTGFILTRAGVEIPLGQIVKVPVARYPTRPAA